MPKTLLIYRLGSIGDTVVALPCLHAIARAFPEYRRIALTNIPVPGSSSSITDVLGASGIVHDEIAYPVGVRSPATLLRLRRQIIATRAEQLVYLMPERSYLALWRDKLFLRTCGLSKVIGAGVVGHRLQVVDPRTGEVERECVRLARSLSALGPIDLEAPENWDLMLTRAEKDSVYSLLPDLPFLAINMGGKVESNDWGAENWIALLEGLAQYHASLGLVVVGGLNDRTRAEVVARAWKGTVSILCGALSVRGTAAALGRAVLFIGHDSGPMHLAAAAGAPVIGLFGDHNPPKAWHPVGPHNVCLHDMRGVHWIHVAEVIACVDQRLSSLDCEGGSRLATVPQMPLRLSP
jgi:ADP-heptose:LPS heptosyltransferase